MQINKIDKFQYIKYILLFFISMFILTIFNNINVLAVVTKPTIESVSGNANKGTVEIQSTTCNKWIKKGSSCTVTLLHKATTGSVCSSNTLGFTFTNNGSQFKGSNGILNPNGAPTSGTNCGWQATVRVYNFDDKAPVMINPTITLSGTCILPIVTEGGSQTCVGSVTATGSFFDSQSGVPNNGKVTAKCTPGSQCCLTAKDRVGWTKKVCFNNKIV